MTNFSSTFKKIQAYCENKNSQDLTVLFLTDGNDTCNSPENVEAELQNLKTYLTTKEITSRFFTIGLSSDHDSVLLSKIAQTGSDLGNFFYVDYSENNTYNYKDYIKECLIKTFEMGNPSKSLSANLNLGDSIKKISLLPASEEEETSEILQYSVQVILEGLPEGEVELEILGSGESLIVRPEEEQNPDTENLLKTEIGITNQVFFDFIQKVVNNKNLDAEEAKEVYDKISVINDRVSEMITEGFKIKNKVMRKNVIQSCQTFKDKCHTVIETLRDVVVNNKTLDLSNIAKLNDLAYKAIRSKGLKRKLDERAIKNKEHYKELDDQIKKKVESFDISKITEENQEIIDFVGDCPLTCLNASEALEEGDCLGICLDISRSTATIADPNQLIVNDVIPTFMCCSAYLDSAAYNLERSSTAAGTFNIKSQGNLATGIGREKVNGILPLYLFNDHWEISKRTIPSVFGFMCTLDIMGYADDQFYTIPYTVLYKCYEKCFENNNDINQKMLKVVLDTCVQIQMRHKIHTERILTALKEFEKDPINRGKDCIPNFRVFLAQILTAKEAGIISDINEYDWSKIIRFLIEEECRRNVPKNTEPLTMRQQNNFLNNSKTKEIVAKAMEIKNLSEDAKLSQEEIMKIISKDPEEEKKGSKDEEIKELIDSEVGLKPWNSQLESPEHTNTKMVSKFNKCINKKLSWMKPFIHFLGHSELPVPESLDQYPMFKEPVVVLAMVFQNHMHPSNKARREAIDNKTYKEILTKEDAESYFTELYKKNLELEISGEETRILMILNNQFSSNVGEMSLIVQNMKSFAGLIENLKVGDGGVKNLLSAMTKNTSLSIYEKLKIITTRNYEGKTMFADKYKVDPGYYKMRSPIMYRLYIIYVHKTKQMTPEQFQDIFPMVSTEKHQKWINNYEKHPDTVSI